MVYENGHFFLIYLKLRSNKHNQPLIEYKTLDYQNYLNYAKNFKNC